MGSRKGNITLDDFNERMATLERTLTENISKSITESFSMLWGAKIVENATNITANATAIDGLATRIGALEEQKTTNDERKAEIIGKLNEELDDIKNRSMHTNLVLKGFPESGDAKEETRNLVIQHLAELGELSEEDVDETLDRCHRGGRKDNTNNKPRNIYMNFTTSRHVDFYIHEARKKQSPYKHERQYTKSVQERRNLAMMERKRLKGEGEIISGYLEYPAKLFTKKAGQGETFKFLKAF